MLTEVLRELGDLSSPGQVLGAGLILAVPWAICVVFTALTMLAGRAHRASGIHPAPPWRTARRACVAMCVATFGLAWITFAPVLFPSESDVPDWYFTIMFSAVVIAAACVFYFVVNIIVAGSSFRGGAGPEEATLYRRVIVIAPVITAIVVASGLFLRHGI